MTPPHREQRHLRVPEVLLERRVGVEGELGIDLLNTRWVAAGVAYDLLDHDDLTEAWLADRELDSARPVPRQPLREARDAVAAARGA
ncbi:hypothetical protein [Saccharothrix sp. ALI-22-I]|uniref:hypothetical protein n=1 Tax=Saccharothrix sp. ALI-22-I TaxID=1933778 RepID=UPI0015C362A2|nr:hypothetical protein [Saccharothrix sp. ALI-22-I]